MPAHMSSAFDKIFKMPVYVHVLAIFALSCLIIYVVLRGIDAYTNHNQAVYVPDVRGLQIEDAAPFFEQNMLRYEIIDSIFSKEETPGAIVKLMPEENAKVKKNRIVSITVNAKTEEAAAIPDIADMSFRQAYALLRARGFTDVEYKYVTGDYRDLTVGVEYGGRLVDTGTRVPLTAKLILVISDGNIIPEDSVTAEEEENNELIGNDESWF